MLVSCECVQVLVAHLPNIELTCRVFVSSPFLHPALYISLECKSFVSINLSTSVFPRSIYIYCTVYSRLYTAECQCSLSSLYFFWKRLICICFPHHPLCTQTVKVFSSWNRPKSAYIHLQIFFCWMHRLHICAAVCPAVPFKWCLTRMSRSINLLQLNLHQKLQSKIHTICKRQQ